MSPESGPAGCYLDTRVTKPTIGAAEVIRVSHRTLQTFRVRLSVILSMLLRLKASRAGEKNYYGREMLMSSTIIRSPQEFEENLIQNKSLLTPKLQAAASFIISHPQEVALEPLAQLATRSGLGAATFVRLAKAMGFNGYSDIQKIYRQPLRNAYPTSFTERISHSHGDVPIPDPRNICELGRSYCKANAAALHHLSDEMENLDLEGCMELICNARVIYVIGLNRSFAAASYLSYALNRVRQQTVHMSGTGSTIEDHTAVMDKDDILISISFPPYAEDTIKVTKTAKNNGIKILAITNAALSPIADGAEKVLLIEDPELHGFRSLTTLMCLLQTLTTGLAYRLKDQKQPLDLEKINS